MMYFGLDDLRQSYVVAGNEIKKFIRSKRFTIYVVLIFLVLFITTVMTLLFQDEGLGETPGEVMANYMIYINLMVVVAATLFASVVIVSEFEERTALILFTKPVKRTSIFIGKVVGCIILESIMIIVLYVLLAIIVMAIGGGIPSEFMLSLGLALVYLVAASSVAIFLSAVMKKGSTSAIITFFFLFLFLRIFSTAIGDNNWFMLNIASDSMATVLPEFMDNLNGPFQLVMDATGIDLSKYFFKASDVYMSTLTMIGWGAVSLILAWIAFIKREF